MGCAQHQAFPGGGEKGNSGNEAMNKTKVRELMTTNVVTLDKQQAIPLAQELMRMMHVRHLPVVGDDGGLVGMVTHRSLLTAQVNMLSQITSDETSETELTIPVAKVMTTEVVTAGPDETVAEALTKMLAAKQGVVVVVEEGQIVGVLTSRDFLELALDKPEGDQVAVEEVAKLAAGEAVARVTAKVVRESGPVAPRWIVWFLAALVLLLVVVLLVHRPAQSHEATLGCGHPQTAAISSRESRLPTPRGHDRTRSNSQEAPQVATRAPAAGGDEEKSAARPKQPGEPVPSQPKSRPRSSTTEDRSSIDPSQSFAAVPDAEATRSVDPPIAPGEQLPLPGSLDAQRKRERERGTRWIPEPTRIRR
jgi:CBS domain-containing membrane protein